MESCYGRWSALDALVGHGLGDGCIGVGVFLCGMGAVAYGGGSGGLERFPIFSAKITSDSGAFDAVCVDFRSR